MEIECTPRNFRWCPGRGAPGRGARRRARATLRSARRGWWGPARLSAPKRQQGVVWIGFAAGGFAFLCINVALAMPHWDVPFNVSKQAFADVFSSARIMCVASLAAYLVGSMADIWMFGWLKRLTGGRLVWLRATGSTVASQMVDSLVVTWLAFSVGRTLIEGGGEPMPMGEVLKAAATGYLLKLVIALCLTPVIYAGRRVLESRFGLVPLPPE